MPPPFPQLHFVYAALSGIISLMKGDYSIFVMFIQAVVEDDPEYVVRRFESGRYSIDSECRRIYQRALDLVEVY